MKKLICVVFSLILAGAVGMYSGLKYTESVLKKNDYIRDQISEDIAVVNLDEGVEVGGETKYYSRNLLEQLEGGYTLETPASAEAGMESGKYGAIITFPANTSACIESINTASPVVLQIDYSINGNLDSNSYAGTVTKIADFRNKVNNMISYTYIVSILSTFHDAQDTADQLLANNASVLESVDELELMDYVDSLELGSIPQLNFQPEGLEIDTYMNEAGNFANDISGYYLASYQDAQDDFDAIQESMENNAGVFDTTLSAYINDLTAWMAEANDQNAKVSNYSAVLRTYHTNLNTYNDQVYANAQLLEEYIEAYNAEYDRLSNWNQSLNTDISGLQTEWNQLNTNIGTLANNVDYLITCVNDVNAKYLAYQQAVIDYQNSLVNVAPVNQPDSSDESDDSDPVDSVPDESAPGEADQGNSEEGNNSESGSQDEVTAIDGTSDGDTPETDGDEDPEAAPGEDGGAGTTGDATNSNANNNTNNAAYQEMMRCYGELQGAIATLNAAVNNIDCTAVTDGASSYTTSVNSAFVPARTNAAGQNQNVSTLQRFNPEEMTVASKPDAILDLNQYSINAMPAFNEEISTSADELVRLSGAYDPKDYLSTSVTDMINSRISRFSSYSYGIENMMNVSYQANIGRMQTELNNYTNYVNNMRNTAINTYNEEQEAFQASVTAYADEVRIINQSNNDLIGSFVELMPESRSGADVNTNVVDAIVEPIEFNTGAELSTAETTSFGDATSKLVYVMAGSGVCALVMLTWAAVDSFKKRKI